MGTRYPPHPLTDWPPLIVNAALTGVGTTRAQAPSVPFGPEQCAEDAAACFAAGARIVHLHARDAAGVPRLGRDAYAPLFDAVRGACRDVITCTTTTGRACGTFAERIEPLALGPDLASLTLGPVDFGTQISGNSLRDVEELARAMRDAGVRPEFEVFHSGMLHTLHRLADRGLVDPPFSVNLLLGFPNGASADLRSLSALVDALPEQSVWAAAGRGAFQRPVAALAAAAGGGVRTGLEDNPFVDHVTREPTDNPTLVAEAVGFGTRLGRGIPEPAELRALLGLGGHVR